MLELKKFEILVIQELLDHLQAMELANSMKPLSKQIMQNQKQMLWRIELGWKSVPK